MINKRNLLILLGGLSSALLVLNYLGTGYLCNGLQNTSCMQNIASILRNLFPVFPLFLMSCIAYFLHEDTFRAWLKFAYLFIPLLMIGIFVSPEYGSAILPITKGSVAMIGSLFFVVVSIGIMLFKSASSKK